MLAVHIIAIKMYVFVADLLILLDVFAAFSDVIMTQGKFEIDTGHYFSTTPIFWDAMLKKTGVELDLISDPAMNLIIESDMRGGVCMRRKKICKGKQQWTRSSLRFHQTINIHQLFGWKQSVCLVNVSD